MFAKPHPISSNGQQPSGVEVLPPIKDWFLLPKELLVCVDQNLDDLAVDFPRAFVRCYGHIVVVETAVGDLYLMGGGGGGGRRRREREREREKERERGRGRRREGGRGREREEGGDKMVKL